VWQIFSRQELFPEMALFQMMSAIVKEKLRPPLYPFTIPELISLMQRGWDKDPNIRPTMEEFLDELLAIRNKYINNSKYESEGEFNLIINGCSSSATSENSFEDFI
jgi:hypothetical protein